MKYAHIIDTKLQGWYSDDIHDTIPTPNIEVTEEVWQEALNINANCYENGKFIVKDFRTSEEIEKQRISSIKAKAEQLITAKYSIIWQLNHPRLDESCKDDYAYIDRIRDISNEAEINGTSLEDITWN